MTNEIDIIEWMRNYSIEKIELTYLKDGVTVFEATSTNDEIQRFSYNPNLVHKTKVTDGISKENQS